VELSNYGADERCSPRFPAEHSEMHISTLLQVLRPVLVRAGRVGQGDTGQLHVIGRHERSRFAPQIAVNRHGQQPLGRDSASGPVSRAMSRLSRSWPAGAVRIASTAMRVGGESPDACATTVRRKSKGRDVDGSAAAIGLHSRTPCPHLRSDPPGHGGVPGVNVNHAERD
jgi:hypothetical protein